MFNQKESTTLTTSTNFLTRKKANILGTISRLEELGQVDPLKTFTNLEFRQNSRSVNNKLALKT